ncbi:MAG: hypothetical protein ACOYXW_14885 [Actinomycetota bacterium]
MLLSAPREDLVQASRILLGERTAPTSAHDLAIELRSRGWTVDTGHLEQVLARTDRVFLRVGDGFLALPAPRDGDGPVAAAPPEVSAEELSAHLVRLLASPWWRLVAVRAAFPPPLEEPATAVARRLDADRRARVFRVAKVRPQRRRLLIAWVDQVTLVRQESLRSWPCWAVRDLPRWRPGPGPVNLRYEGLPPQEVALVRAEPDAGAMAELLLTELMAAGVRPGDVWIEPVPVDGRGVEARQRELAAGAVAPEWVGAITLDELAGLVADPPQGGAPGLSRGRVGEAPRRR